MNVGDRVFVTEGEQAGAKGVYLGTIGRDKMVAIDNDRNRAILKDIPPEDVAKICRGTRESGITRLIFDYIEVKGGCGLYTASEFDDRIVHLRERADHYTTHLDTALKFKEIYIGGTE